MEPAADVAQDLTQDLLELLERELLEKWMPRRKAGANLPARLRGHLFDGKPRPRRRQMRGRTERLQARLDYGLRKRSLARRGEWTRL